MVALISLVIGGYYNERATQPPRDPVAESHRYGVVTFTSKSRADDYVRTELFRSVLYFNSALTFWFCVRLLLVSCETTTIRKRSRDHELG